MAGTQKKLLLLRRGAQILSVSLLIYIIWSTRYPLSGFINPRFYFMIDPFAIFVTSIAERVLLPGLIYSTALLVLTFIFGRGFCGFICPLGALQDFTALLAGAIKKTFSRKNKEGNPGPLRYLKYGLFGIILGAAFFGIQFAWFLDPITIFVRAVSFNLHPFVNAAIDTGLMRLSAAAGYPEPLELLYDWLRRGFLSLSTPEFPHTNIILIMLAIILFLVFVKRRFWCRYICPLGGMLALPARASLLRRNVDACVKNCGVCKNTCRMNAIRGDNTYLPDECVLCFDCTALCPNEKATFSFKLKKYRKKAPGPAESGNSMTRALFISLIGGAIMASAGFAQAKETARKKPPRPGTAAGLRPPGALPEKEFIQRCIRCGNCMKVCPTNLLTPSPIQRYPAGAWSPVMDTRRGYCEYSCNLCGQVCPTEAIRKLPLEEKKKTVVGIAVFNEKICLPYAKGEACIVCEEHCPVPDKAIKLVKKTVKGKRISQPVLDKKLCIGCAVCELKCPTAPDKGVIVVKLK